MWLGGGRALKLITKARYHMQLLTMLNLTFTNRYTSDIPDRKLEIPGVGLTGPNQEATILTRFQEQLLCLLGADISVKLPMRGHCK